MWSQPTAEREVRVTCSTAQEAREVARRSGVVGIGVGLHPGYNAAQRLYVKRGYIPDARGITYRNRFVEAGRKHSG